MIEIFFMAEKISYKAPPIKKFLQKFKMRTTFEVDPTEAAASASSFA
jgi:hypothetical protein